MIQVGLEMFEIGQVLLREMQMLRVERFEVTVEKLDRDGCIKRLVQIVHVLKHAGGVISDLAVGRSRRNMIRPGRSFLAIRSGSGSHWLGGEEWEKQPAAQDQQHHPCKNSIHHDLSCLKVAYLGRKSAIKLQEFQAKTH